jgi:hypothetical protein
MATGVEQQLWIIVENVFLVKLQKLSVPKIAIKWGGTATIDNCNNCVGGNTGNTPCIQDCDDEWGGTAKVDNCGTCDNNSTNDCVQDCNDMWGGTATIDNCNNCIGGITRIAPYTIITIVNCCCASPHIITVLNTIICRIIITCTTIIYFSCSTPFIITILDTRRITRIAPNTIITIVNGCCTTPLYCNLGHTQFLQFHQEHIFYNDP